MASVQELILAAQQIQQSKRSPLVDLVNTATAGFDQGRQDRTRNIESTLKLMQIDQARQDMERQRQMDEEIRQQLSGQREGIVTQAHKSVAGGGSPVLPAQKLQVEVSQDEKGLYSRKFKTTDTAAKDITYSKAEYLDAKGETRIGRFNPSTGRIEQSPDDLRAPKSAAEASAVNGKMLPANTVLALNEGKNVARLLPEVETAIQENLGKFGPVTGRARGANPYDESAQTFDAQMRAGSQSFGRFMEGGVLRKEDEEKYRKMFPQMKDADGVKKNKLSIIRKMLAEKYEDDRKTLGASGYDVSGFEELSIPESVFGGKGGKAQKIGRFEVTVEP